MNAMNHLDEGTIHAWLDGALDADRARAVEAHAASCAQCSALVAEARGLVAGASRILTALDDVPAGVTPKRSPTWGPRAWRQWRAAPWVMGIAAALMLAVGVRSWRQTPAEPLTALPGSQRVEVAVVADSMRALADARQRAESAGARAVLQPVRSEPTLRSRAASSGGAGMRVAGALQGSRGPGAAAPAPSAIIAAAAAERRDVPVSELAATAGDVAKKAEALPLPSSALEPPAPAKAAAMMKAAAAGTVSEHERDVAAAGCYRIDPVVVRRSVADAVRVTGAAGAAGAGATPTVASPRPVRTLAEDRVLPPVPERVQLDTTPMPRGYVVRAVSTGERLGFWFRVRDSLRVELLVAGAYTLPASARVTCPER